MASWNILDAERGQHATITNIQLLRFLAAFIVMFGHAQLYVQSRGLAGPAFREFALFDFQVGVDIFFVVSGFVMYYVSSSSFAVVGYPTYFLSRRLIRILPLYWTATAAMLLAISLFPSMIKSHLLSWEQVICSFLFLPFPRPSSDYPFPIVGVGWTLNYEMLFYCCFFLILMLRRPIGLLVLTVGFVSAALLHAVFLRDVYVRFLSEWTEPIIIEFLFGVGLAVAFAGGWRCLNSVGCLFALLGVVLLIALEHAGSLPNFALFRPIRLGIPALIICSGLALSDGLETLPIVRKTLVFGGDISYSIYLSHEFTFNTVCVAWRAMKLSSPWELIAILCVASIVVAAIIHRFLERPITGKLNQLLRTWRLGPRGLTGSPVARSPGAS